MDELLSPIEAIMWRVGQDPALRMTVGLLVLLDQAPAADALAERLGHAIANTPRLRQLPDDATFTQTRPAWIDDPEPAAKDHLRMMAVAPPGSLRQVLDLVALLESVPFDTDRPPWDVTLIEGMDNGQGALFLRAHHVVTDGLAGVRLAGMLLDEPGWPGPLAAGPDPKPVALVEPLESTPPGDADDAAGAEPRTTRPGTVTIDLTKVIHPLRDRVAAARETARETDAVDVVVRGLQHALDVADSVSRQVMVTGGPLSPLFLERSSTSRFEAFSVAGAREAALGYGGSRNDLLVAATAVGLGLYHERLGAPCSRLRLAMPARQGGRHQVGGNWFAPARVEVPTANRHPGPQFGMVAERLAQARHEPALQWTAAVASVISRLPTRVLVPALHAQADSVDFAATALPGLHGPRRICGAVIEASYPFGPRLGCPANITAFGNDDRLDVGIAYDPAAITDPPEFLQCLAEAFETFVGNPAELSRAR
jgi:diacylglycerol O-acyltransferase